MMEQEEIKTQTRTKPGKWYIIQVVPSREQNVKEALENRIFEDDDKEIEEIFLPLTTKISKSGAKKIKPMFPGYLYVKLLMTDQSWYVIRNTEYVIGIIGSSGQRMKPTPVSEVEIERIRKHMEKEKEQESTSKPHIASVEYEVDNVVKISEGNFVNQSGKVKEISFEKQTAVVEIEFFGRKIQVTLPLDHIRKA